FGGYAGLGLFAGRVVQIASQSADGATRKIPHIGWTPNAPPGNVNDDRSAATMVDRTANRTPLYFVHSLTPMPFHPSRVLASADYAGAQVTAAIGRDNITGVQFHPEKSGPAGLALIERFLTR